VIGKPLATYLYLIVLIGILALIGAYQSVVRYGKSGFSIGGFLILYSIAVGAFLGYYVGIGRLIQANYELKVPIVVGVALAMGAAAGVVSKVRGSTGGEG